MSFASSLSSSERKRARINAYASTWFGSFSEVMMDSSAIIILFITMLEGSETLTMFSTSLSGIAFMFLMIPCASLVNKMGLKRSVSVGCYMGCAGYLIMAAAPFFGMDLAKYVVMFGCFIYCVSRPIYGATWYPLLDNFLCPSERASFFGFMRFSYMMLSGVIFFIIGLMMGAKPPVWLMQLIIGITGLLLLGRKVYVDKFPAADKPCEAYELRKPLSISIKNGPLVGFSIYVCCITAAYCSIVPLTFIYMKKQLFLGDNVIQVISALSIGGSICGFFAYGNLLKLMGMKTLQVIVHAIFIVIPLLMFFCGEGIPGLPYVIASFLFICNFAAACFLCCFSMESLALARPGNKIMAIAFSSTYSNIGTACGRIGTSLLLGSGMLVSSWSARNMSFCKFQSLFIIYSALALFFLILLICIPSVVPKHEDYYEPI